MSNMKRDKVCEPAKLDFCTRLQWCMGQQWFTIRQYGDKMYVCCYLLNQEDNNSFVADLKDEVHTSVTLEDGTNLDATREHQIHLKKGQITNLHIFEYCSFCGVRLDLPGPKKTQTLINKQQGKM